jgi:hypothetical protein
MVFVVGSIYILTKRVRIMDELLAPQGRLASENEVFEMNVSAAGEENGKIVGD